MNKAKLYDWRILPKDAQKELFDAYVSKTDPNMKIRVFPDPNVANVYAVEVTRTSESDDPDKGVQVIHLLWTNDGSEQYDEVEFETFPPRVTSSLHFML